MPRNCKCGGSLQLYRQGKYSFTKKCNKCGVIRTQRKRLPLWTGSQFNMNQHPVYVGRI